MRTKHIVVLGGGSGVKSLIEGLGRREEVQLTCVHPISDSGGSQGSLCKAYNLISGMSDTRNYVQSMLGGVGPWSDLLTFRFDKGLSHIEGGLGGHNLGTLLVTACYLCCQCPEQRAELFKKLFNIRHDIFPVSAEKTTLWGELTDGLLVMGEHDIDKYETGKMPGKIRRVWLEPRPKLLPIVQTRLESADMVVVGPGDIYTSLSPLLLTEDLPGFLKKFRKPIVFTLPLEWRQGFDAISIKAYFQAFIPITHFMDPYQLELVSHELSKKNVTDTLPRSVLKTDPDRHAQALMDICA